MTPATTELVAGEITAWRAWFTQDRSSFAFSMSQMFGPRRLSQPKALYAIATHRIWPASRPVTASCMANRDHGDIEAPAVDCGCGVYAVPHRAQLQREYFTKLYDHAPAFSRGEFVIGTVGLWGRTIVHEHGYRAQYATPRTLVRTWGDAVHPDMAAIAERYGVTIVDDLSFRSGIAWAVADRERQADEERRRRVYEISKVFGLPAGMLRPPWEPTTQDIAGILRVDGVEVGEVEEAVVETQPDRPVPKPKPFYRAFEKRDRFGRR